MQLLKKQVTEGEEETIILQYMKWNKNLEDICAYIQETGKQMIGYGPHKEMFQIKLADILYFEAVGELVFAYTKDQMYEMKMRLYQIEKDTQGTKMRRASKSIIVNLRKIKSVRPALNGRLYAKMINGEEVMISRQYAKNVVEGLTVS